MRIYSRVSQVKYLKLLCEKKQASLFAIYGRRRIGKTYLVNEFFISKKYKFFKLTGVKDAKLKIQIFNFKTEWKNVFNEQPPDVDNWPEALTELAIKIKKQSKKNKVVFFFLTSYLGSAHRNQIFCRL